MIIENVEPASEAERAGLLPGDCILTYDGKTPISPWDFLALQENTFDVESVVLSAERGGERLTFAVKLGALGVTTRPELPTDILAEYERGREAFDARLFAEAAEIGSEAAHGAEEAAIRAFLLGKVGAAWERIPDWAKARDIYLSACTTLEESPDSAAQTVLWRALGLCYNRLTDFHEAERRYQQAVEEDEKSGRPRWAARGLFEFGEVAFSRDDHPSAQARYEQGLDLISRYADDSLEAAQCLTGIGNIIRRTDAAAAGRCFTRAVKMAERVAPDSLEMAFVLNHASFEAHPGDFSPNEYCERALQITERRAPDSLDVALSLSRLGVLWRGRSVAQNYHRRALSLRQRFAPGSRWEAVSHNDMGLFFSDQGDFASSRHHLLRALEIIQRVAPESRTVAQIMSNVGNIEGKIGKTSLQKEYCQHSLDIFERLEADTTILLYPCLNLGRVALKEGDLTTAQEYFTRVLSLSERLRPDELGDASSFVGLSDIAFKKGDLAAAREYAAAAFRIAEQLFPESLGYAEMVHRLGRIIFLQGYTEEAHPYFIRATEVLERRRGELGSSEMRAFLLAQYREAYASLLKSHIKLHDLEGAFFTQERARARSFLELLAERAIDFSADAPPQLLERQRELDERRALAYDQLSSLAATGNNDNPLEDVYNTLRELELDRERLTAEIRAASPRYAALQYPQPLGLEAAQAELEPGTLLLSFFVAEDETFLFAVTHDSRAKGAAKPFTLPFGRQALEERVRSFRQSLDPNQIDHDRHQLLAAAQGLYNDLLRPAHREITKGKRLLLCLDGPLHILPFAALAMNAGRKPCYLGAEKTLHHILSVTLYAQTRRWETEKRESLPRPRAAVKSAPGRVLAFGDPLYPPLPQRFPSADPMRSTESPGENAPGDDEFAQLQRRGLHLTPLDYSREEVLSLARLFGDAVTVKLGADATKTAVLNEARDADILHFACHGWLDTKTPLRSGLALSQPEMLGDAAPPGDNGLLQVWEIFQKLELKADLVTLSACQSGLGHEIQGEGLVGLTRAFQYAGARSLIVSLFSVNDASTALFMEAFYAALKAEKSKDAALQAGVHALQASAEWHHPFYWSAFLLLGDRN